MAWLHLISFPLLLIFITKTVASENEVDPGMEVCDKIAMTECFFPLWVKLSHDAIEEGRARTNSVELLFNEICDVAKSSVKCYTDHINRCVSESFVEVHKTTSAMSEMLKVCDDPDGYYEVAQAYICYVDINDIHQRCAVATNQCTCQPPETLETTLEEGNKRTGQSRRDICCAMRKHELCVLPEAEKTCRADGVSGSKYLLEKFYTALQRSKEFSSCSSSNAGISSLAKWTMESF